MQKSPNKIFEIFDEWFSAYNLSATQKQEYVEDLCSVIFPTIILKAQEKLSTNDRQELEKLVIEKTFEKILPFIERKYSEPEWVEFLDKNIAPILDSYRTEVLEIK